MSATPYRLTTWADGFVTVSAHATFVGALAAYANCADTTKSLLNDDLRDAGSGLTDEESDAIYSLPGDRAAFPEELKAVLISLEALS